MQPLVTCVMPTKNRHKFVPTAIRCFMQQTYPNKELVIVESGADAGETIRVVPEDERITLLWYKEPITTGDKRNIGAQLATGEIIANWDDDDWSSPHRLEDQVNRLQKSGKAVTGYNQTMIYHEGTGNLYLNAGGPPYFASGTSQCYYKSWWTDHKFPDCCYGEDSVFSREARLADQLAIAPVGHMIIAVQHGANTETAAINKLLPLSLASAPSEFITALHGRDSEDIEKYIRAEHQCSPECREDVKRQLVAPIVEYKISNLPPVKTR